MKTKQKKVQKMLGQEEATMLSNVQSILSELLSMSETGGAPADPAEVDLAEADPTMDEQDTETEGKEVKMIVKGLEETPSDSATASDDAEERMDEPQTDQSTENVNEVVKALISALGGTVKKSEPKPVDPVTQVLSTMAQVQKANQEQMNDLANVMKNLLEGLGIVEQMKVAKSQEVKTTSSPSNVAQNLEVLKVIKDALGVKVGPAEVDNSGIRKSNSSIARSNLNDARVLKALLGK